jgi:3-phenylpropionate/cinnamic acid dioxygenase small subunit
MSDDETQRLLDIDEICQLRARYTRMIDTKDWDGYGALVVDDFKMIGDGGTRNSRDEIIGVLKATLSNAVTLHQVHMPEITVDGDTASGVWAMQDIVTFQFPDEEPYTLRGYGHYHETYTRTPDGWRLASSHLTRLRVDTEGELPVAFRG